MGSILWLFCHSSWWSSFDTELHQYFDPMLSKYIDLRPNWLSFYLTVPNGRFFSEEAARLSAHWPPPLQHLFSCNLTNPAHNSRMFSPNHTSHIWNISRSGNLPPSLCCGPWTRRLSSRTASICTHWKTSWRRLGKRWPVQTDRLHRQEHHHTCHIVSKFRDDWYSWKWRLNRAFL